MNKTSFVGWKIVLFNCTSNAEVAKKFWWYIFVVKTSEFFKLYGEDVME